MKYKFSLLLLLLLLTFRAFPAYAQTAAESDDCSVQGAFNITNSTGADIKAIYIAKAESWEWSENLLSADTIVKKNTAAALPFMRGAAAFLWRLKTVDTGGREVIREKLPLSFIYDIELTPDGESKYRAVMRET